MRRRVAYFAGLLAALASSFLLTLWLLGPLKNPATGSLPAWQQLARARVSTYAELGDAVRNAGFRRSPHMQVNIEKLTRTNDREVTMVGWFADPEGDATPIKVMVFVGGVLAVMVETKGERPDVTQALGLGFGAEKNVGLQASFACKTGDQPIVVGLGMENQYFPALATPTCP